MPWQSQPILNRHYEEYDPVVISTDLAYFISHYLIYSLVFSFAIFAFVFDYSLNHSIFGLRYAVKNDRIGA